MICFRLANQDQVLYGYINNLVLWSEMNRGRKEDQLCKTITLFRQYQTLWLSFVGEFVPYVKVSDFYGHKLRKGCQRLKWDTHGRERMGHC